MTDSSPCLSAPVSISPQVSISDLLMPKGAPLGTNRRAWGWKDGSEVNSVCYSSCKHKFGSQHPGPVAPSSQGITHPLRLPAPASCVSVHTHTHTAQAWCLDSPSGCQPHSHSISVVDAERGGYMAYCGIFPSEDTNHRTSAPLWCDGISGNARQGKGTPHPPVFPDRSS